MKFKVGDLVIGTEKADETYSITRSGFVYRVKDISSPPGTIYIEFVRDFEGNAVKDCRVYPVDESCFEVCDCPKSDREILKILNNLLLNNLNSLKVSSLDYDLSAEDKFLHVGCQTITKKDALKIADFIQKAYK